MLAHNRKRAPRRILAAAGIWLLAVYLVVAACGITPAPGKEVGPSALALEEPIAGADLILAVRVTDVSEKQMVYGGKQVTSTQQFTFTPVRTLKGVYTRETLQLTSDDLGIDRYEGAAGSIERGQMRLLILGRTGRGFANRNQAPMLDLAIPPLRDENDPLLAAADVLIAVAQERDRSRKVARLIDGLRAARGTAAIPLLRALDHRSMLAAQTPGSMEAIAQFTADQDADVRTVAAMTTRGLLESDYLEQRALRTAALAAIVKALDLARPEVSARVEAIDALGAVGDAARDQPQAVKWLEIDRPAPTFAERTARVHAVGKLHLTNQLPAARKFLENLALDAPPAPERATEWALGELDQGKALAFLMTRLKAKQAAGLDCAQEILAVGDLPAQAAVPALIDVNKLALDLSERRALASACNELADPRLVPVLAGTLDPRYPQLRWQAIEALRKIDTDEAAKALQPHLREEGDIPRKLEIAELLGRHGIRDGYSYAIEHMSEENLRDEAVAALAAINDPRTVPALRQILQTSHDIDWNSAAIRALGRMGVKEFSPQFLNEARDLRNHLAPSALLALGDLGETKALPILREALSSRNDQVVIAAARAAAKILAVPGAEANDVRERLASIVADADLSEPARMAALESLIKLNDSRLDRALTSAAHDAGIENTALLAQVNDQLRKRKVSLTAR